MEKRDIELIQMYVKSDYVLKSLYEEHLELERRLQHLNGKPVLTPTEEVERKKMQKVKLAGRDRMEDILTKYRSTGA